MAIIEFADIDKQIMNWFKVRWNGVQRFADWRCCLTNV